MIQRRISVDNNILLFNQCWYDDVKTIFDVCVNMKCMLSSDSHWRLSTHIVIAGQEVLDRAVRDWTYNAGI